MKISAAPLPHPQHQYNVAPKERAASGETPRRAQTPVLDTLPIRTIAPPLDSHDAASPTQCTLNVQCENGAGYGALCLVKTPTLSVCWCTNNVMTPSFDLNESVAFSCCDALTNCAPNNALPSVAS